jgi:hypothetical protein
MSCPGLRQLGPQSGQLGPGGGQAGFQLPDLVFQRQYLADAGQRQPLAGHYPGAQHPAIAASWSSIGSETIVIDCRYSALTTARGAVAHLELLPRAAGHGAFRPTSARLPPPPWTPECRARPLARLTTPLRVLAGLRALLRLR